MKIAFVFLISILTLSACSSPEVDEGIYADSLSYYARAGTGTSYYEDNTSKKNFKVYKAVANEIFNESTMLDCNYDDFNLSNEQYHDMYQEVFLNKFMLFFYFSDAINKQKGIKIYFAKDSETVYTINELNETIFTCIDKDCLYHERVRKAFDEEMLRAFSPMIEKGQI